MQTEVRETMSCDARHSVLIVASPSECPQDARVWGTGGWTPPETREALDWLTLVRLMGWGVRVVTPRDTAAIAAEHPRTIVLACQEHEVSNDLIALLSSKLANERVSIIARVPRETRGELALLTGARTECVLRASGAAQWLGPGPSRTWQSLRPLEISRLTLSDGMATWATCDGTPVIVARHVGRGLVATIAFHPSAARDLDGAATALLRHLLIWGSDQPAAWVDLEATLVLRMDDPGSAERVHHREWNYPPLGEAAWRAIGDDLSLRNGRLSVGYVSGWIDDGDATRGELEIAGARSPRTPGSVHSSPHVKYIDRAGHSPGTVHDLQSEYRGIQQLRARGLGDVELHGHTHCHGDRQAWAAAPDRYETQSWFREFGAADTAGPEKRTGLLHPIALGLAALARHFDVYPTTLICPGDAWTDTTLEVALGHGLQLVGSYYLGLRHDDRFCWATHVCAPYLDEADAEWFDAGLPVVGYFHDRELSIEGVEWMRRCLDRWQAAGARQLIDYRELAGALTRRLHLDLHNRELHLIVDSGDAAPTLVRPLRIGVRLPDGWSRSELHATADGQNFVVPIDMGNDGIGRAIVPVTRAMRNRNSTGILTR